MWFRRKKHSLPLAQKPPSTAAPSSSPAIMRTEVAPSAAYTDKLERRIQQLEKQLAALSERPAHIHIETLHVHQPVLDSLTFRLDQLDIGELSGSLNLGNNFGAKTADLRAHGASPAMKTRTGSAGDDAKAAPAQQVGAKPSKATTPSAAGSERSPAASAEEPVRTETGYRYHPKPSPPA
ncbi:hypothetical protein ABE504_02035 [Paenibacillus oryzisoli]|uniref:hypothetical protein n=1 Tax=Paenibacillus oryzisoli TaxID=1850517 RepID=UPI003D2AD2EC